MIYNRNKGMKEHLIGETENIRTALERLNALSGRNMTLFVTDGEGRLSGSLTDGDLRRALMHGADLYTPVAKVCNKGCLRISGPEERYSKSLEAKRRGISLLPATDREGRILSLIDMSIVKSLLPVDAVMMAGGRGERLRPLTLTTPKPLLKIGGRPIIDYNIESLMLHGVESITVTVNYLREQIERHFAKAAEYGGRKLRIECVAETERLGTMGSLSLIKEFPREDIIVMNSDLLTTIDFAAMYERHKESGAALTMGVIPYSVNVPFAIIDTEGDRVTALQEKPTYNYLANAGVYIMRREIAESLEKGKYLDAPDLIDRLIAEGKKVGYYRIEGTWIDIGSPADFARAEALMNQ